MGYLGSVTFLGAHMEVLDFYQIYLEDTARKMIKDGGWPMMNVKQLPHKYPVGILQLSPAGLLRPFQHVSADNFDTGSNSQYQEVV